MKLFLVIMALLGSVSSAATLKCLDEDSKLTLSTEGSLDPIEGEYKYNKSKDDGYGSLMVLGCKVVTLDDIWDLLDCTETTYSVYGPLYQIPKDTFKNGQAQGLTVKALSRDENDGSVYNVSSFENCSVK